MNEKHDRPASLPTRPVFRIVAGRSSTGRPHIGEVLDDVPYSRARGTAAIREVEQTRMTESREPAQ